MATKTAKKNSKNRIDELRAKAQKINQRALNFSENVVEETLASGAEWQEILEKAVKNGTVLFGKQQDIVFETLEAIKGQTQKTNKRFRQLLSFKTTKENKVEKKKTETAKTSNPAPTAKARVKKIAENVAIEDKKLKTAPKTKLSKSNLKLIEGIGPKLESILNEAGILTFDQLAKAKPAKIKTILETAGPRYKMHDPTSWSKQAKLAAANKMEELKALQAELKGGKATK